MRLVFAMVLTIPTAACTGQAEQAAGANAERSAPAAQVAKVPALPRSLLGAWAPVATPCTSTGASRMVIEPETIRVDAQTARITAVTQLPDGVVAVDALVATPKGRVGHSYDFHLSPDGKALTRVEGEVPDADYRRCDDAPTGTG